MTRSLTIGIITLMLFTMLFGGCSGNSNNAGLPTIQSDGQSGKAVLTIKWPSVSRLIPAAAYCIKVSITDTTGFAVTQVANRPANGGVSTLNFNGLPVETLMVTATAYPGVGGTGTAQATGTAPMYVQAGKTVALSLTMNSTIDHVTVAPSTVTIAVNGKTTLVATAYDLNGNVVVTAPGNIAWSSNNQAVATVDPVTGIVTGVNGGTVTVTATESESGKQGTALVTVPISVSITPRSATVNVTKALQFSDTVYCAANTAVVWSVVESDGGTITDDGLYTAPAVQGTYHVSTTSVADPTKSDTATVTVQSGDGVITIQ